MEINPSRRRALKLAAGAGLSMSGPFISLSQANDSAYDVIVIGAGMAGLYATKQLLAQGYKVRVLEASDRHGGRIYSQTLGDTRIDMGAEEHYLKQNNPIYKSVVKKLGKDAYAVTYDQDTLISMDGGQLCWEETGSCSDDPDINNYWKYLSHYGNPSKQTDFSTTMADEVLANYGVDKNHRAYHLYDSGIAGSIYGASLQNIGAASLATQDWKWTLSEDIRVLAPRDIGYLDILDRIWWNDLLPHVSLNSPVTEIDTKRENVTVIDDNGRIYSAKKVIITASIGVLQSETIRFTPELPKETVHAYSNIGMGRGMKVALRFKDQFWDSKMTYLITEGLSSSAWVPSSYKKDSPDNIVMCYPMGDNAQLLVDIANKQGNASAGDQAIVQVMLKDLDLIFGGKASELYLDSLVQNWTSDPFVRGSYSYPMLKTYATPTSLRQQLAKPVADQLFFAGEGTNNANPSCVPGALQEGARAAKQIHKLLNIA